MIPLIELPDQFLSGPDRSPAVQPEVLVVLLLDIRLNDGEHHLRLAEEEDSVALLPPELEQRVDYHHLPTALVETKLLLSLRIPLPVLSLCFNELWTSREEVRMIADLPQSNQTHEDLELPTEDGLSLVALNIGFVETALMVSQSTE